jgi:hypothetical protein
MPSVADPAPDLVIRARRAVLPDGTRPAAVRVSGGVITGVTGLTKDGAGLGGGGPPPPPPLI